MPPCYGPALRPGPTGLRQPKEMAVALAVALRIFTSPASQPENPCLSETNCLLAVAVAVAVRQWPYLWLWSCVAVQLSRWPSNLRLDPDRGNMTFAQRPLCCDLRGPAHHEHTEHMEGRPHGMGRAESGTRRSDKHTFGRSVVLLSSANPQISEEIPTDRRTHF